MTDNTNKLAAEFISNWAPPKDHGARPKFDREFSALLATPTADQATQGAEPVAWFRTVNGIKAGISFERVSPNIEGWLEFPLYAHPAPASASEPLQAMADNERELGLDYGLGASASEPATSSDLSESAFDVWARDTKPHYRHSIRDWTWLAWQEGAQRASRSKPATNSMICAGCKTPADCRHLGSCDLPSGHPDRASASVAGAGEAQAECVQCERCGHENWIMEGKAPCQITAADRALTARPVAQGDGEASHD